MITDEMVNAVGFAMLRYTAPKGLSDEELNEGGMLECGIKLLGTMSERVLEAVYPLVRAQVLEEAAKVCDELGYNIGAVDGYDYRSGQEAGHRLSSQAIRNLKGETK